MNTQIIPNDKFDVKACDNLFNAYDQQILNNLDELLGWVQDFNWPVAPLVAKRLIKLDLALEDSLRMILMGNDDPWKYWIITELISNCSTELKKALSPELRRIAAKPTAGERCEELNNEALKILNGL